MKYTDKLAFANRQLVQKILAQNPYLSSLFNQLINSVAPELRKYRKYTGRSVWYRNSSIEKSIERKLIQFQAALQQYIQSQQSEAWALSNSANDSVFRSYIRGMSVSDTVRVGLFDRNMQALTSFQNRVDSGMNLSRRVWNITEGTKSQLEFYLESGISQGRSAANISQDVRQILNNPDKRFRRIKNPETGKLVLSQPMANYHPGRGEYRSAFKNALRLTSTETNLAYRMADHERWGGIDFVMGIDVNLSGSHPKFDICDSMAGRYPKNFVFGGWHPACICYATPVLLPPDAFVKYLENDHIDMRYATRSLPSSAVKYVHDHKKEIAGGVSTPYWYRDNFTTKGTPKKSVYYK